MIAKFKAYCRLMRFDKPVGIGLLWFPVAWALWIANRGSPPWDLLAYFFLGTLVMRAAGCIVNDMADRHVDSQVQRTSTRPLATGEVGLIEAICLFIGLLFVAFYVVIHLPLLCFYQAWLALLVTIVYPFCKRWLQAPQLMLSIAFSVAIPMVYTASRVDWDRTMVILLCINMLWVLAYDTMYAMVDRADDLRVGIQSTAVLLGHWDCRVIGVLQALMHSLWLVLASSVDAGFCFYSAWLVGLVCLIYQQILISSRLPADCFHAFKFSLWYGFIMWLSVLQNASSLL